MNSQPAYRVVPLARDFVQHIRRTMTDPFGHRLQVYVNEAHGNPCRFTLRQSPPGEELILLSHRPFATDHPYAETGPIFIRRHGDEGYQDVHRFPPEIDPATRLFRAYDAAERIVGARVGTPDPDAVIADLFANPAAACIHVRSLTYGCYTFKIVRA